MRHRRVSDEYCRRHRNRRCRNRVIAGAIQHAQGRFAQQVTATDALARRAAIRRHRHHHGRNLVARRLNLFTEK